ncbi:MAG: serine hydrolase domain-containing protein [Chitinophagales bacterium]
MKRLLLPIAFTLLFINRSSTFASGGVTLSLVQPEKVSTATVVDSLSPAEVNARVMLDRFFQHRYRYEGFNGTVLIAHNGKPIYHENFGYADMRNRKQLRDDMPFELASVSKTFTGTAILKLVQQEKIYLDDPVNMYFPEFPYEGITIRTLLSHRSGLLDYVYMDNRYIADRAHYMDNDDVVQIFCKKRPPLMFAPNSRFHYSNSNYALLAEIVHVVTGQKFQDYMRDSVFEPLGMKNTFVFDFMNQEQREIAKSHDSRGNTIRDVCFDGVVGDKGIFSTAADMLTWDNALRDGKVLTVEMLQEAYEPRSFERCSFPNAYVKNYGYGWRMTRQADGNNIIYHNGYWHGNNNVFARNLRDNTTIIVLGNKLNQGNYGTDPIWNILKGLKEPDATAGN